MWQAANKVAAVMSIGHRPRTVRAQPAWAIRCFRLTGVGKEFR
jgi:hypothetical protein